VALELRCWAAAVSSMVEEEVEEESRADNDETESNEMEDGGTSKSCLCCDGVGVIDVSRTSTSVHVLV